MAACGTYTATGITDAQLGLALALANADHPVKVQTTKAADGTWTVVATYPPCPDGASHTTIPMADIASHAKLSKIVASLG